MRISGRSIRHQALQDNHDLVQQKAAALKYVLAWANTLPDAAAKKLGDMVCGLTVVLRSRYSGLEGDKDRGLFANTLRDEDNLSTELLIPLLQQLEEAKEPHQQELPEHRPELLSTLAYNLALICTQRHTTLTPVARLTRTGGKLLQALNFSQEDVSKKLTFINQRFKDSCQAGESIPTITNLQKLIISTFYAGDDSALLKISASLNPQTIDAALRETQARNPQVHDHFLKFIGHLTRRRERLSLDEIHIYAACFGLTDRQITTLDEVAAHQKSYFSLWTQTPICVPLADMLSKIGYSQQDIHEHEVNKDFLSELVAYNIKHTPDFQIPPLTKSIVLSVDFSHTDLTGKNFQHCHFKNSKFHEAILTNTDFSYATLTASALLGADLSQAKFTDTHVSIDGIDPEKFPSVLKTLATISEQPNHHIKKTILCNVLKRLCDPRALPSGRRVPILDTCKKEIISWIARNPAYNDEQIIAQFVTTKLLKGILVDEKGHEIIRTRKEDIPLPTTLSFIYDAPSGTDQWPWFYRTFASSVNQIICTYINSSNEELAKAARKLQDKYLESVPLAITQQLASPLYAPDDARTPHIVLPCLQDQYICISPDFYEQRVFSDKPQVGWNQFYFFKRNDEGQYVMAPSMNLSFADLFASIPLFKQSYAISRTGDAKLLELFTRLGLDEFIPDLKKAIEFPYYDGHHFKAFWEDYKTKNSKNPNQTFLSQQEHIHAIFARFMHIKTENFEDFIRKNTGLADNIPVLDQYGYFSPQLDAWIAERFDQENNKRADYQGPDFPLTMINIVNSYERNWLVSRRSDETKALKACKKKELKALYQDRSEEERNQLVREEITKYNSELYLKQQADPSKPEPNVEQRFVHEYYQTYLTPEGWDLVQDIFLHDKSFSKAGVLRSLAAVFTQLSSFTFFGEEKESIAAFRIFAAACFNMSFQFEFPSEEDLGSFHDVIFRKTCAAVIGDTLMVDCLNQYPKEASYVVPVVWKHK